MKKDLWILKHATAEISVKDFFRMRPEDWNGCAEQRDTDPETVRIFESEEEAGKALKEERCECTGKFSAHGIYYVGWEDYSAEHVVVDYDPSEESWEEAYGHGEVDYPGEIDYAPCLVTVEGVDEDDVETFPETVITGKFGSVGDAMRNAYKKISELPAKTAEGLEITYTIRVGGAEADSVRGE